MWGEFHFIYPWFLVLLLALPLVLWLLYLPRQSQWQHWIDKALAPYVLTGKGNNAQYWQLIVLGLAWVLAVIALAGPSWQKREVPVYENPHALVIGLDLSISMWAKDVAPDRLSQARFKLLDILKKRKEGQTALVVFAGDAFVVIPLTNDVNNIAEQVKNLSPDIMPALGSRLAPAIVEAQQLMVQTNVKQGDILLITDGVDDAMDAQRAAQQAAEAGYTVSTLTLGTEKGAPIPIPNQSFLLDQNGKTVLASVNKTAIASIAQAGQGLALEPTVNDSEISQLQNLWEQHLQTQAPMINKQQVETWLNAGYWLLIPLMALVLGVFRRGWLLVLVGLVLVGTQPQPAWAFEVKDLFTTPDQKAMQAMQNKDYTTAAQQFTRPDWKAAAAYEARKWAEAEQFYKDQYSAEGRYNYGNSLAQQGKFEEAIKAYDEALALNPNFEDAKYNRQLSKEGLEKGKKQQSNSNKGDKPKKNDSDGDDKNQQSNNSSSDDKKDQQNQSDAEQQGQGKDSPDQMPKPKDETAQNDPKKESAEQKQNPTRPDEQQPKDDQETAMSAAPPPSQTKEQQQATEQWLGRIPDNPSELWRRKFLYQYQQRNRQEQQGAEW